MKAREITQVALLAAMGVVLPSIFHLSGIPGKVFLPMHIPVLLGGFLLRPQVALLLGLILPPLNFLLTGMPPFPNFIAMMFELGAYGFFSSLLYGRVGWGVLASLLSSMLLGRLVSILANWALFIALGVKFNLKILLQGLFIVSLPGIAIQLVAIPTLLVIIWRWGKIEGRAPRFL